MLVVRVTGKQMITERICLLELSGVNVASLPPFTAGSHIDIHLPGELVRQYSLCGTPASSFYSIAVQLEVDSRGGSAAVHRLEVGAELRISEPRNQFPLASGADHTILIAGGIGVTPILSMAEELASRGSSFEFHYCVRTRQNVAFSERLASPAIRDNVKIYVTNAPDDSAMRLHVAALFRGRAGNTHAYACGPARLIDDARKAALDAGWPGSRFHAELFAAPEQIGETPDTPFSIVLARSGRTVQIPAHRSAADVLLDHGVDLQVSCGQGICGACLTRVVEGIPDHRDFYLTKEEHALNDNFTPCCSRAKSATLVVDL